MFWTAFKVTMGYVVGSIVGLAAIMILATLLFLLFDWLDLT